MIGHANILMFPQINSAHNLLILQASEMLLFGKKINAQQAYEWGLVTEVFPDANFHEELKNKIAAIAALPKNVRGWSQDSQ